MNHKILEQIKGGAFLAGDLPVSTSSYCNRRFKFQQQQVAYFELPRVRSSNFEFPQVRHGTSV